jgi:hypothetical protein
MGAEGYGVIINTEKARIDCLAEQIVFVNPIGYPDKTDLNSLFDRSRDERFLIVEGAFETFIVDLKLSSVTMFRETIRARDIWCDENPIWGDDHVHIDGLKRHYFVQFPFFSNGKFIERRQEYRNMRLGQIEEAKCSRRNFGPGVE